MDRLSYLGGLIDGEGCLTLCKTRNKAVSPVFSLASTSDAIISFIVLVFEEYGFKYSITNSDRNDNSKPYKTIRIQGSKSIKPFLDLIEDYLIEKKPQLLMLKEFVDIRSNYGKNNMKWEETAYIVDNIRKLNFRGKAA